MQIETLSKQIAWIFQKAIFKANGLNLKTITLDFIHDSIGQM